MELRSAAWRWGLSLNIVDTVFEAFRVDRTILEMSKKGGDAFIGNQKRKIREPKTEW